MNLHRLTSLILIALLATPAIATASSMVTIPEGPFTMGKGKKPPHGPERRLFLKSFLIDQGEVTNYADVMACDTDAFARFFHHMLDSGVYLAPASYEAGFMSSAHGEGDIAQTIAAARTAFASL